MAERQHPGKSEQEIQRHRRQPKHQHARGERGIAAERRHPIGREQQRRPDRGEHDQLARLLAAHVIMPSSPSNPRGRISKHDRHHDVDDRLAGGREKHRGHARCDADQQAAEQRAGQAADAADDDGDEARHQQAGAHGRLEAELPGRQHAAQSGEKDADREIERAQHSHVDAERGDGLEIERAGADANAEPRIAQQHEQQRHRDITTATMNRR